MSRNSITPSRAFFTSGVLVLMFIPGPAGMAQEATGLGLFSTCWPVSEGWEAAGWRDGTDGLPGEGGVAGCQAGGRGSAPAQPGGQLVQSHSCAALDFIITLGQQQAPPNPAASLPSAERAARAARAGQQRTSTKHMRQLPAIDSRWW